MFIVGHNDAANAIAMQRNQESKEIKNGFMSTFVIGFPRVCVEPSRTLHTVVNAETLEATTGLESISTERMEWLTMEFG
ncbi:hypothetical protein BLOT_010554 [Blomia tropicalis]|nr:hypothetical protein BLOT_010554 [Blomia tropicalis]